MLCSFFGCFSPNSSQFNSNLCGTLKTSRHQSGEELVMCSRSCGQSSRSCRDNHGNFVNLMYSELLRDLTKTYTNSYYASETNWLRYVFKVMGSKVKVQ